MADLKVTVFTPAAEPSITMDREPASENSNIAAQIDAHQQFGIGS